MTLAVPLIDLDPGVLDALTPAGAWLGSWLPPAVLAVVCAGLAVLTLRRRGKRAITAAATVLTLLAATAATINTISGYVPTLDAARVALSGNLPGLAGTLRRERSGAPDLGVPDADTYVYLPPGYARGGGRRYPVVYLFHGSPGRAADWFAAGSAARTLDVLIGRGLIPPMIAVAPDLNGGGVNDTECLDDPDDGGPKIETYLRDRLVPWTDARYDTDPRPGARILAGMSAGGFCALDQGLRHRDVYGPIVSILPFGDPGEDWRERMSTAAFDAVSPRVYLPTIALPQPVPVFLGLGLDSPRAELTGAGELQTLLTARGNPLLRHDVPGEEHSWRTARLCLPYGLIFAARYLPS